MRSMIATRISFPENLSGRSRKEVYFVKLENVNRIENWHFRIQFLDVDLVSHSNGNKEILAKLILNFHYPSVFQNY